MTATGRPALGAAGTAPDEVHQNDHVFAAWAAHAAGELLLRVRAHGGTNQQLRDEGDRSSHELLLRLLTRYRSGDAVLSEEGTDTPERMWSERTWIIDPLDGTREFAEPPRDDWAVHVALCWEGGLTAGAVAQPGLGITLHTGAPPEIPEPATNAVRIAVSRTRPPAFVEALAERLGATLVPMGSAGAKVLSVVRGVSDVYVHAGGQYEWDSAAPVAVARAAGLFTSRLDGSELRYNQSDAFLPDLLVCRSELAEPILAFLRNHDF